VGSRQLAPTLVLYEAQTPFNRLMNSGLLSEEKKQELVEQKKKLNPFHLRAMLDVKLEKFKRRVKEISSLPKAG